MKKLFNNFIKIAKTTIGGYSNDNIQKLSASLAYTTIFSLAPLLLLVIIIAGNFYGEQAIRGEVFDNLKDVIGAKAATDIQSAILNITFQKNTPWATAVSVFLIVFSATRLFVDLQSSLNVIWGVRPKGNKGWVYVIFSRLLSFLIIIAFGIILALVFIANTAIIALSKQILEYLPDVPIGTINVINSSFFFCLLFAFVSFIYKWLPDVHIKWKDVLPGALLTSVLFVISRWLINLYIVNNATVTLYGAAGSFIILLLWIYISATIFYVGAELSYAIAMFKGRVIIPNKLAELDSKQLYSTLLENHKDLEGAHTELKVRVEKEAERQVRDFQVVFDVEDKIKKEK